MLRLNKQTITRINITGTENLDAFDIKSQSAYSFLFNYTETSVAGTIKAQLSNDGVFWFDDDGKTFDLSTGTSFEFSRGECFAAFVRLRIEVTSGSLDTFEAVLVTALSLVSTATSSPPIIPVEKSGNISTETWTGIIHVTGDIVVLTGQTLTIAAGTIVKFLDNYWLTAAGSISAIGTGSKRIKFIPHETLNLLGTWYGIVAGTEGANVFILNPPDAAATFNFSYCDWEDTDKTTRVTNGHSAHQRGSCFIAELPQTNTVFDNCTFTDAKAIESGGAIYMEWGVSVDFTINDSIFTRCTTTAANAVGGGVDTSHGGDIDYNNVDFIDCVSGTVSSDVPVTVDNTVDEITVPVAHGLKTGNGVVFSGTPPSPLVGGTEYYCVVTSTTKFKVASTVTNANIPTLINLTDNGSSVLVTVHYDFFIFDEGSFVRT